MNKKYFLTAAIIWMIFIFMGSSQPAVKQDVKPFIAGFISEQQLEKWLPAFEFPYANYTVTSKKPYDAVEFFIRKTAHITEYFILSVLWQGALGPVTWLESLPAVAISILFAGSDELHQTFVIGRTGHIHDVLVDSLGILLGMAFYLSYVKAKRNKINC